jgi:hypothetical protein
MGEERGKWGVTPAVTKGFDTESMGVTPAVTVSTEETEVALSEGEVATDAGREG